VKINQAEFDRLVMSLLSGTSPEKVIEHCQANLGLTAKEALKVVNEARKKITLAADFVRDEQLGVAITRLNDIYARAIREMDNKTALQAQRELNKLMGLYSADAGGTGSDGMSEVYREKMELIKQYILPLELVDEKYPIEEHVRVAAEIVRENKYNTSVSGG
jgi:hypothetical protein